MPERRSTAPEDHLSVPDGKSPQPDAPSHGQDSSARRLRIHGRVQGVGYRGSATAEATRLSLSGWVRNRSDGSVEALAIGPLAAVEAFVAWAHHGPANARVSRVEVFEAELDALRSFEQRPTT